MNSDEFKRVIQTNPKNIYILVSIDSEMIDLYASRFQKAIGAELVSRGKIKPYGKLFKKKTLNIIYMPKIDESIFDRHEYIFIYTDSIDKRTAVYKQHKDQIIELNNNYVPYILKNSNMTESEANNFVKINRNDFGLIKNNLTIYNDSDMCYNRFTDYSTDIYGWVDAFLKKQKLPRVDESPISIMALLSTNCQNILKIKQKDTVGMNPYIIKCNIDIANNMSINEIVQIINDCFYLDCQIKKGLIDVDDTLKYLIARRYNATSN